MRSPIRAFWFQTHQSNQCWPHHISIGAAVALVVAGWSSRGWAQEAKDILWYGNSFTNAVCCGSTRSVPSVVADVAVAAGQVAPRNRNASVDGQSLEWHRTNNTAVINSGIAAGQQWEHVVLQDTSTQPTHIGNLALHRSSTVAMYNLVAAHSPAVVPVTYETWARGPGYSLYTGASPLFPGGPAQMQAEVRQGYQLSTADINAAVGTDAGAAGASWRRLGARGVSAQLLRLGPLSCPEPRHASQCVSALRHDLRGRDDCGYQFGERADDARTGGAGWTVTHDDRGCDSRARASVRLPPYYWEFYWSVQNALAASSYGIRCTPLLPSSAEIAPYSDAVPGRGA